MIASKLVLRAACAFAPCLLGLVGCANATEPSSGNPAFGEREACPGAFAPHSDECWDPTKPTSSLIMADRVKSEELGSNLGDRCAMPIGQVPGVEGSLTISFNTVPLGATQYGPRNCGGVWIEDASENYIRTVELWVKERQTSITMWDLRNCDMDPKVADVISSPTLDNHIMHKKVWDTKDWRGNVVPDGKYSVWLQVTENEIVPEGPYIQIEFTKGAQPFKSELMAADGFTNVVLEYVPTPVAPGATAP